MALSQSQRKAPLYPAPIIVEPQSGAHSQSFIILHGRGSNGERFGLELLNTLIPGYTGLQNAFPNARFIFPTAAKRRAHIYKRTPTHQWFDNYFLHSPTEREELQFEGLRESTEYVHGLLKGEIVAVGPQNVILWGLSQGCAMSLISSLLWQGEEFAATIGMCGWLPLRKRMEFAVADDQIECDDDPFGGDSTSGDISPLQAAIGYLRDELDMPLTNGDTEKTTLKIPRFLGHGTEDEKVPVRLGQEAACFMRELGIDTDFIQYDGLGHWYSEQMLKDIISFIDRLPTWSAKVAD